jgi:hypothetical protein
VSDDKRFEDKVGIEDLIKTPQKELLARIYQQVLKTNGTVAQNCTDIKELQTNMDDKIGNKELLRFEKVFGIVAGVAGFIIVLFNILDRVM